METTNYRIRRCAWVTQFLYEKKRATMRQIMEAWQRSQESENKGEHTNRKTWYRCFYSAEEFFGVIIEGGKKQDHYQWYILNPEVVEENNFKNWMLSFLSYRNLIDECVKIQYRFDLEPFPSENDRLQVVVKAMREQKLLMVIYQKYGEDKMTDNLVQPYYIKTYQRRFYVLCRNVSTNLFRMYSFDRIVDLKIVEKQTDDKIQLTAKEFFNLIFGVLLPSQEVKPEKIIIRAYGDEMCYLRDVPIHHSQMEIRTKKDYADFMLFMYPTRDFTGYVIHQEDRLEILSPQWLRDYMEQKYRNGLRRYVNKD